MKNKFNALIVGICLSAMVLFGTLQLLAFPPTQENIKNFNTSAYDEHFPEKNRWLELNATLLRLFRIGEYNNVVRVGKQAFLRDDPIEHLAQKVNFVDTLAKHSKHFSFVALPSLSVSDESVVRPYTFQNTKAIFDDFLNDLKQNQIDVLNLSTHLNHLPLSERYLKSDHHWKPSFAFKFVKPIAKHIASTLKLPFNESVFNAENYTQKAFLQVFLGTLGKRVGYRFTGLDDFSLILPTFETDFTVESPFLPKTTRGNLEHSLIFDGHLKYNYYELNPYKAYMGDVGKHAKLINHNATNRAKVLYLIDSYSLPLMPYLALLAKESYVFDLRFAHVAILEEIKKINPDMVVMQYSPYALQFNQSFSLNPNP